MAANNYFGFTHGGTQYGATGAAAYQTGQPGYAVAPTPPPAATYTAQRPAPGYETAYQTAPPAGTYAVGAPAAAPAATYDYGYGRAPQQAYDNTKTYYQQPAAAPATYATTETHYQAAKPAFSTTSAYTPAARQVAPVAVKAASYNTAYSTQGTQNSNYAPAYNPSAVQTTSKPLKPPTNTTYSGYDAALYSAATMYVAQQAQTSGASPAVAPGPVKPTGSWQGYKKGPMTGSGLKPMKPKQPPKPQQLHYCDVCKISCAGPQTYREHLEGQKHKKKESAMKAGSVPVARGLNALRCELCDVTCTGSDAYAAHIRGAKHQKVVKLHTKLGKPIPSTAPVVVSGAKPITTTTGTGPVKPGLGAVKGLKKPAVAAPKVNFVASGSLGTVNVPVAASTPTTPTAAVKTEIKESESPAESELGFTEKDVVPVGLDYIEEIKNDEGKVVTFNCKLCECRFNDPNAKDMHMKGRRHRLQYKKKVNPELVVDMKTSLRQRKLQDEKMRRQQERDDYWRSRQEERSSIIEEEERMYWEERRRYEEEMDYLDWYHRSGRSPRAVMPQPRLFGPPPPMFPPGQFFPQMARRPDSADDRHVLARHADIYPKEDELAAVQRIVSHTEKALKFTSDFLADAAAAALPAKPAVVAAKAAVVPAAAVPAVVAADVAVPVDGKDVPAEGKDVAAAKPAAKPAAKEKKREDGRDGNLFSFYREKEESAVVRVLKGVMRVGVLAKGLLLHGDTQVDLVVLCAEKPSRTLLNKVAENLPRQLALVAPGDTYKVQRKVEDAAIVVMGISEPHITVTITLTSPVMREQLLSPADAGDNALSVSQAQVTKDPPDVLDKQKCLDALAALRHAKWFQARATGLQSCVMVIRILRDLCQRVPTWAPLHSWPMELLVEKVISSAGPPMSPGDALRRIMEALASGILQPFGPGLLDPCEKDPVDAAGSMLPQQREDITASAQHALRLMAFRQIYKVLGMDQLPMPKFNRPRLFNRKRRRDSSAGEGTENEGGDEKKDKKEEVVADKMDTEVKVEPPK